jgi:hypothetical protein
VAVLAMHSKATPSWGSPPWLIEIGQRVLGGQVDVDLATSAYWNLYGPQAPVYFDEHTDALAERDWSKVVSPGDRTWCNPPGLGGQTIRAFFRLMRRLHSDHGVAGFWVGFSVEQIGYLGRGNLGSKNGAPFAVPPKRIGYMQHPRDAIAKLEEKATKLQEKAPRSLGEANKNLAQAERLRAKALAIDPDGPPLKGEQPTHSSYLALLPTSREQVERFDAEMKALGAEVF